MTPLSHKQKALLAFLRAHIRRHGQPPPVSTIAAHFAIHRVTAYERLDTLARSGWLSKAHTGSRTSYTPATPPTYNACPACGRRP